ncbi:AroM family protein [Oceanobacillus timonensis]|uniref:AroM family protein n=1 Tax=Oceanobacillus timonensis TaxID=1926285 RepID=UPI0009B9DEA5|nr:AroM family protein [Oceanobacillus timonensis]
MVNGSVGVLTIGQAPRTDVTPSIQRILGPEIEIVERGALDRLDTDSFHTVAPDTADTTYISRVRNGGSVKMGKSKLLPLLQEERDTLEEQTDVIMMLCTGDFPTLQGAKPIIYPDVELNKAVREVMPSGNLGLIIPLEEQRDSLIEKWNHPEIKKLVEVASPYEKSDIEGAARALKNQGADLIVLDCMGYNEKHEERAMNASGLSVFLPRKVAAYAAKAYLNKL